MARKRNFRYLAFTLTEADMDDFTNYYVFNSPNGKRSLWLQKLLVPFLTVSFFAICVVCKMNQKLFFWGGAILVFLSIVMWVKAEDTVLREQRALIEGSGGFGSGKERKNKIEFGDDVYTMEYNEVEHDFEYKTIKKVDMTDTGLYIWTTNKMVFPIPKRVFARENDMRDLRDFILGKITK